MSGADGCITSMPCKSLSLIITQVPLGQPCGFCGSVPIPYTVSGTKQVLGDSWFDLVKATLSQISGRAKGRLPECHT